MKIIIILFHHFDTNDAIHPSILCIHPATTIKIKILSNRFYWLTFNLQFISQAIAVAVAVAAAVGVAVTSTPGFGFDSGSDLVVVNEVGWPCRASVCACPSNLLLSASPPSPSPPPPPLQHDLDQRHPADIRQLYHILFLAPLATKCRVAKSGLILWIQFTLS